MDPLIKRVKTEKEKVALIAEAKKQWDALDPAISHLVAVSEEAFLAGAADRIEVEREPFVPARPPTAAETAELDGKLMFMQLYGDRADDRNHKTGCEGLDKVWEQHEAQELVKLFGPALRQKSEIQLAVDAAVADLLSKGRTVPRRESEREPLVIRKGASSTHRINSGGRIEVDGNECTEYAADGRFLRCWIGSPSERPDFSSLRA